MDKVQTSKSVFLTPLATVNIDCSFNLESVDWCFDERSSNVGKVKFDNLQIF